MYSERTARVSDDVYYSSRQQRVKKATHVPDYRTFLENAAADARVRDAVRLRVRRVLPAALRVFGDATRGELRVRWTLPDTCRCTARRHAPEHHRKLHSASRAERV